MLSFFAFPKPFRVYVGVDEAGFFHLLGAQGSIHQSQGRRAFFPGARQLRRVVESRRACGDPGEVF